MLTERTNECIQCTTTTTTNTIRTVRGLILIRRITQPKLTIFTTSPRKYRQSVLRRPQLLVVSPGRGFAQRATSRDGFGRAFGIGRALSRHIVSSSFDVLLGGLWVTRTSVNATTRDQQGVPARGVEETRSMLAGIRQRESVLVVGCGAPSFLLSLQQASVLKRLSHLIGQAFSRQISNGKLSESSRV